MKFLLVFAGCMIFIYVRQMKSRFAAVVILVGMLGMTGCETIPNVSQTEQEKAIRDFDFQGLKLGSRSGSLAVFSQVQRVPLLREGMTVYEIFNPSPQVSKALAFYHQDRLRKLELRYFDGPGARTLTRAGGWVGIRDYLIAQYGPPSRFATDAPIVTAQPGLRAEFAKFNGEWIFSRVYRQLNFIAMADTKGGVGVVTISDTSPLVKTEEPAAPGSSTRTRVVTTTQVVASPAPTVVQTTPVRPNPGF